MNLPESLKLLTDLSFNELKAELTILREPAYRAYQVWDAIYSSLVNDFQTITNLPVGMRQSLTNNYIFTGLAPITELSSADGQTSKVLFETNDGKRVETVLMRYNERITLCISTQSGCAMGCSFCATGHMGFFRSLSPGEIVSQVLFFSRKLKLEGKKVTNLVFMGMGEPFHNYEGTMKAISILGDEMGFNMGARRMTISTVGIVPQIMRFADENTQINLAISLHSIDNNIRSSMMPVNDKYPVEELLNACAYYAEKTNRRLSFEWALIKGVNDSPEVAHNLAKRVHSLLCHVNLIQLNPTIQFTGQGSTKDTALRFKDILVNNGMPCSIRLRRGIDINAGCGQLASSMS